MDKRQTCTHIVKGPRVPQLVEVGIVRVAESQVVPHAHAEVGLGGVGRVEETQPVGDALPVVEDEGWPGGVVALAPEVHPLELVALVKVIILVKFNVKELPLRRGKCLQRMGFQFESSMYPHGYIL